MNRVRVAIAFSIALLTTHRGSADPIDVILEVDPLPTVVVTAFGNLGGQELQEQFTGSLQSTMSGHVRVRFDPSDPDSIEFLPADSHLDLSTGTHPAQPGGLPANLAGQSPDSTTQGAVRNAKFDLTSGSLAMTPAVGSSQTFASDSITARFVHGDFDFKASPFAGSVALAGLGLGENTFGIDGSFTWFPEATGDNLFVTLPIQYRYQPFGDLTDDQIFFVANVRLFASFSLDNVAPVGPDGGAVEVLGGASVPGGVSATISEVAAPGSFTVQQIHLDGLPDGALDKALLVPDLAYSLSLADYTNPCFDMGFTGKASSFELTLGYADNTHPSSSEDRLVLYHYTAGAWEKVAGQILDTKANTIKYTNPGFSPFMLAVSVPEPSSAIYAMMALLGLGPMLARRITHKRA